MGSSPIHLFGLECASFPVLQTRKLKLGDMETSASGWPVLAAGCGTPFSHLFCALLGEAVEAARW